MDKIVKILVVLLSMSMSMFSQVKSKKIAADTIVLAIDYDQYRKVGLDSISRIYYNQQKRIMDGEITNVHNAISTLFALKDLECNSIPTFKLKKTDEPFDMKSSIETYIDFNQDFRFQQITISLGDKVINCVSIPNIDLELSRMHKGKIPYTFDKTNYDNQILRQFINSEDSYFIKKRNSIMKANPENLFFTIFGLRGLLFEIDKKTGVLFVSNMNPGLFWERENANDFLVKHLGVEQINDVANGLYDLDKLYEGSKKCPKKRRKIVFKTE
jgi:hypothetical protein